MTSAHRLDAGNDPLLSVVIPTRDRTKLLKQAIASVVRQDIARDEYELIVVDNDSSGNARETAETFPGAPIRYVHEPRAGLCIARNTGWRSASGRYVIFFDDDAIARPGWLAAIKDAFERSPRSVGVIGGRVDPIWQASRPAWLSDAIAASLTIVDWGPSEKIIPDIGREWLVGANMAIPKALLAEIGGFHPWLDRVGDNLLSSGDVFLQKEAMRRGYECLYVPAAAIEHLVPPSRLERRWFLKRFYWQGVSDAVMHLIERKPSRMARLRSAASRSFRLVRSRDRMASLARSAEGAEAFKAKCFALIELGFISGLLGAAGR